MSAPESTDIRAIKEAIERLASGTAFETSKYTFEFAQNAFNVGNFASASVLCDRTLELDDPIFATLALFLLADVWRRVGRHAEEMKVYQMIAALPRERRKFADPTQLGVALTRAGRSEEAKQHYLQIVDLYADNGGVVANLSELLLTMLDFRECVKWTTLLAAYPSAPIQIIARVFKGAALFFLGDHPKDTEEFAWVGKYLLSVGSVPPDFSWDFGDSRVVLDKIDLPPAVLVVQLLDKRIPFQDFVSRWQSLFPTPSQVVSSS
jgi:tetratricopeptide (TPR) repeat protein